MYDNGIVAAYYNIKQHATVALYAQKSKKYTISIFVETLSLLRPTGQVKLFLIKALQPMSLKPAVLCSVSPHMPCIQVSKEFI